MGQTGNLILSCNWLRGGAKCSSYAYINRFNETLNIIYSLYSFEK